MHTLTWNNINAKSQNYILGIQWTINLMRKIAASTFFWWMFGPYSNKTATISGLRLITAICKGVCKTERLMWLSHSLDSYILWIFQRRIDHNPNKSQFSSVPPFCTKKYLLPVWTKGKNKSHPYWSLKARNDEVNCALSHPKLNRKSCFQTSFYKKNISQTEALQIFFRISSFLHHCHRHLHHVPKGSEPFAGYAMMRHAIGVSVQKNWEMKLSSSNLAHLLWMRY